MQMHSVLTPKGVLYATLEMGSTVQVRYKMLSFTAICFVPLDIDECELGIHTCDSNANCTDTGGTFNCTCIDGFEGDGFQCTGE